MPEWIEPISKEQAQSAKQLPVIKLYWETTTVPETPVRLPIPAFLSISSEAIRIHAERDEDPEYGVDAEQIDLQFRKEDIVSLEVFLLPESQTQTSGRSYWSHDSEPELKHRSRAVVRHRDPYEVVPYFESIFTSTDDYWLRALVKTVKDRLGIKQLKLSEPNQSKNRSAAKNS